MKLFTKSDLERAARLSLLHRVRDPEGDPEWHIREAVAIVAAEGPEYLSRDQALAAATLAAQMATPPSGEPGFGEAAVKGFAEEAIRRVLREVAP